MKCHDDFTFENVNENENVTISSNLKIHKSVLTSKHYTTLNGQCYCEIEPFQFWQDNLLSSFPLTRFFIVERNKTEFQSLKRILKS